MTRCLRQAHISWNDGFEDLRTKEASKVGSDLLREACPVVIHGEENAFDRERRVNRASESHQRVEQLGDALQGQVFALNGNEDRVACRQGIQGQEIEGRWAIDENVIVFVANGLECGFQPVLALVHVDEFDGGTDQILVRRNQIQSVYLGIDADTLDGLGKNEGLIERPASWILRKAESARRVSLRIAVDDEGAFFGGSKRGAQVDACGCLADAAFLIDDGDDARQIVPQAKGECSRRLRAYARCFTWNIGWSRPIGEPTLPNGWRAEHGGNVPRGTLGADLGRKLAREQKSSL